MPATILDMDGYDDYSTAQLLREHVRVSSAGGFYSIAPTIVAGGRFGGSRLQFADSYLCRALPSARADVVVGFAWQPNALDPLVGASAIIEFRTPTDQQLKVVVNPDGSLAAYRGSANEVYGGQDFNSYDVVLLGTSPAGLIHAGRIVHLAVGIVCHATEGEVHVRVNNTEVLTLVGVNTRPWDADVSNFLYGNPDLAGNTEASSWYFDDLVVSTAFLGDRRVDSHLPVADGDNVDFAPSTGSDLFAVLDEAVPNDDTDYADAADVNNRATCFVEDYKNPGQPIDAIKVVLTAKKTAAGTSSLATCIREAAANHDGTAQALSTDYGHLCQVYDLDPETGVAWDGDAALGAAGSAQFGAQKAA